MFQPPDSRKRQTLADQDTLSLLQTGNLLPADEREERRRALEERSSFIAADTQSIANGNESFAESLASTVTNIPKFIAASIVSGGSQLYNIVPSIGNALGGDFEKAEIDEVMEYFGDDLARYYEDHGQAADIVGFMVSSMVPGLGGIKVLHAGQAALGTAAKSGRMGQGIAKSFGLLKDTRQTKIAQAVKALSASDNPFKYSDANVMKALGAGFGQGILEATAFEVAVAATMFDSPVLEDQTIGDLAKNIALGGVVFGSISGVMGAAGTVSAVKKGLSVANKEAAPWQHIVPAAEGVDASDRLLHWQQQINQTPQVPLPSQLDPERIKYLETSRVRKIETLEQEMRKDFATLAGGDQDLAQLLWTTARTDNPDHVIGQYLGAKSASRLADISPAEKEYIGIVKKMNKASDKTLPDDELMEKYLITNITYTKNWGDDIGNITFDEAPRITQLSDTLKKGQSIEFTKKGLKAGDREFKFSKPAAKITPETKPDPWDVTKHTVLENNARNIWASKLPALPEGTIIKQNDTALLARAYKDFSPTYKIQANDGSILTFNNKANFLGFIKETKEELAIKMLDLPSPSTKGTMSVDEIASALDMRTSYLGGIEKNLDDDLFALSSYSKEYSKHLRKAGKLKSDAPDIDVFNLPQHTKVVMDATPVMDLDGHVLEGMAVIKQREVEYRKNIDHMAMHILGEDDYNKLLSFTDEDMLTIDSLAAGAKFLTAASSDYGTVASKAEYLGRIVNGMKTRAKEKVSDIFNAPLVRLAQKPEAAIEFSVLNNTLRSLPDGYTLNRNEDALIPTVIKRYEDLVESGAKNVKQPRLKNPETPREIPIENDEVLDLVKLHIEVNGVRRGDQIKLRTAQGMQHKVDTDSFYPIPVNPREYPFFATVTDESITGSGHTKMIFANDQRTLDDMISKIQGEPGIRIRTKKEAEAYYDSIGQFDYDKTINENFLDSFLERKGVSSPYYVPTDPKKITEDFLSWHSDRASSLVMETVSAKYEKEFGQLIMRGQSFTNLATSKVGSLSALKHVEEVVENPYVDYIKTALDVRNYSDYPFWTSANRAIDAKLSQMGSRIAQTADNAKTPQELTQINDIMREYGYKGVAYDEEMLRLANHDAPRGLVSNVIQKANAVLATVILRLDHMNAVNNLVGTQVLYAAEMQSVLRAIERGDSAVAGELAKLAKIKVPGTDKMMLSPTKLISNAIKRFGTDNADMKFYKDHGFVTSITDQYRWTLDQMTLGGKASIKQLDSNVSKVQHALVEFGNKGEKWTGNRLVEEFNRFVAADTMKQITDLAVKHGIMDSKTALSYINTFVNRTQGNYLASQRPMLFQGPIGQAIGLFQTYQFNLLQQLFRHVGDGRTKDYITLLGMQGSIYGLNGMPAFNAINTHIIGTASGNTEHTDAYSVIYGAAGKEAGDWLTYGLASNFLLHPDLKTNIYVRGDINPRHVTVVPTNPADIPSYQASVKFFSNLFETAGRLAQGGDVGTTLLRGLEHNGISRPLAGLAQTLQGLNNPEYSSYSTNKAGNVIASNDLLSLANMSRLLGGKPMAEAIATDASFRLRTYSAYDSKKRQALGETVKSTLQAGNLPTREQLEEFQDKYARAGGKQQEFNKWILGLYRDANTSQANKLKNDLESPYSQTMQKIMGGQDLVDFTP